MYHLHIRRHSQGDKPIAMKVFDYICRIGDYKHRGDKVRCTEGVYFPGWASSAIGAYWYALDKFPKRINARLLYTVVVAIPRRLSVQQQNDLVHKFALLLARTSSGIRRRVSVPVAYAIHEGVRSDDAQTDRLPNPHAHFMASTSVADGVSRPLERWFVRANAAAPAKGGAPRSKVIGGRRWLIRVRRGWAKLANIALRAAGLPERIDHRSHRARGLEQLPTSHMGPHAAAVARAGKPGPVAKKNARIKTFNDEFEAWTIRHRKRMERERLHDEQELVFVLGVDDGRWSGVRAFLQQHPFAKDHETLVAAAPIIVQGDRAVPAQFFDGGPSDLIERLRRKLQRGSALVPDKDRVWILQEGFDCIAVAGRDYVACDSVGTSIGTWVGRIAVAMGITAVVARTPPGNDTVRSELDDWMSANGGRCRWSDAATAAMPKRNHRPGS